jgi:hypothetical protein
MGPPSAAPARSGGGVETWEPEPSQEGELSANQRLAMLLRGEIPALEVVRWLANANADTAVHEFVRTLLAYMHEQSRLPSAQSPPKPAGMGSPRRASPSPPLADDGGAGAAHPVTLWAPSDESTGENQCEGTQFVVRNLFEDEFPALGGGTAPLPQQRAGAKKRGKRVTPTPLAANTGQASAGVHFGQTLSAVEQNAAAAAAGSAAAGQAGTQAMELLDGRLRSPRPSALPSGFSTARPWLVSEAAPKPEPEPAAAARPLALPVKRRVKMVAVQAPEALTHRGKPVSALTLNLGTTQAAQGTLETDSRITFVSTIPAVPSRQDEPREESGGGVGKAHFAALSDNLPGSIHECSGRGGQTCLALHSGEGRSGRGERSTPAPV